VKKIEARAPIVLLEELKRKLASAGLAQPLSVTPLLSSAELLTGPTGSGDGGSAGPRAECKLEFVVSDRQAAKLAAIVAETIRRHETGQSGHLIVLSVHENYEFGRQTE
jgi:hypothetical protein